MVHTVDDAVECYCRISPSHLRVDALCSMQTNKLNFLLNLNNTLKLCICIEENRKNIFHMCVIDDTYNINS